MKSILPPCRKRVKGTITKGPSLCVFGHAEAIEGFGGLSQASRRQQDKRKRHSQKIAKDLGFDLSDDEIYASLNALEKEQREKTEKVALDDSALDQVAGGAPGDNYGGICQGTFVEGEWCWFTDYCAVLISDYDDIINESKIENAFGVCKYMDKDDGRGGGDFHYFDGDDVIDENIPIKQWEDD